MAWPKVKAKVVEWVKLKARVEVKVTACVKVKDKVSAKVAAWGEILEAVEWDKAVAAVVVAWDAGFVTTVKNRF
jgi:hypothetical protein